jgi:hypothetical protein
MRRVQFHEFALAMTEPDNVVASGKDKDGPAAKWSDISDHVFIISNLNDEVGERRIASIVDRDDHGPDLDPNSSTHRGEG